MFSETLVYKKDHRPHGKKKNGHRQVDVPSGAHGSASASDGSGTTWALKDETKQNTEQCEGVDRSGNGGQRRVHHKLTPNTQPPSGASEQR